HDRRRAPSTPPVKSPARRVYARRRSKSPNVNLPSSPQPPNVQVNPATVAHRLQRCNELPLAAAPRHQVVSAMPHRPRVCESHLPTLRLCSREIQFRHREQNPPARPLGSQPPVARQPDTEAPSAHTSPCSTDR